MYSLNLSLYFTFSFWTQLQKYPPLIFYKYILCFQLWIRNFVYVLLPLFFMLKVKKRIYTVTTKSPTFRNKFQCLPLRILKISSVASFSDVIFWTETQLLTALSWHSFFLSRKAGVSSRLLPLWTCHFFSFFFPIYFFLELVKGWVANNVVFFTCR